MVKTRTEGSASPYAISVSRTPVSRASKSVILHDWWIVKAEEETCVAIAGFCSREKLGTRFFRSAPVCKRNDTTTLETDDGMTVTIMGHVNRQRMRENGFPNEVCNRFLVGFPYNWRDYISQHCDEELAPEGVSKQISVAVNPKMHLGLSANSSSPDHLNNLSAIKLRELVMRLPEDSRKSLFDDIVGKFCNNYSEDSKAGAQPNIDSVDKTPRTDGKHKQNNDNTAQATNSKITEAVAPSTRVTRSMSARRNVSITK